MFIPDFIFGFDLSLTETGYYAVSKTGVEHCGLLVPAPRVGIPRLDYIVDSIDLMVSNGNTLAVIEDFSFASKGQALFEIGGLGYIVRHRLWRRGVRIALCAPPQLKKFATGKGNAEKSLILKEVFKRWSRDFYDDNVADAFVLATIGKALAGWVKPETSFQEEVVEKIRAKGVIAIED